MDELKSPDWHLEHAEGIMRNTKIPMDYFEDPFFMIVLATLDASLATAKYLKEQIPVYPEITLEEESRETNVIPTNCLLCDTPVYHSRSYALPMHDTCLAIAPPGELKDVLIRWTDKWQPTLGSNPSARLHTEKIPQPPHHDNWSNDEQNN